MQLKTSFFNRTLFKKNLSRYWPLWGLTSFGGALFPLALLVNLLHYNPVNVKPLEMRALYYNVLVYGVPGISIVYAILCALAVWNYLYSARSVGMMHTLPVRRDGLFFTNVISGLTMMAIPYAVTGVLAVLVSLVAGAFDPWGTLVTIGGVICDSVFFFGFATLCAMVVGNVVALPLLYGLLNFIAVLTDWAVNMLARGFIFGLTSDYSGVVNWLSPVVCLMEKVRACSHYVDVKELDSIMNQYYYTSRLDSVTLENGHLIVMYGLVGLVLLAAAFCIYRKRRSESAGDVISIGALKPVFRYGVAAYTAILGGRLLYALFVELFDNSHDGMYQPISMAVCMFVAGAIGYYGACMILAKSARVFHKKTTLGLAAVALGCAALCAGMYFDVFGVGRNVPETDKIDTLTVYVSDNQYYLDGARDAELIEAVRDVQKTIIDQQDYIRERNRIGWVAPEEGDVSSYARIELTYQLKNGVRLHRSYRMFVSQNRMNQPGTYDYAMDQLVNGTAMRQRRIHADDGAKVTGGGVYFYGAGGYDLNTREAAALLAALSEDAAEGTWGTYQWFDQDYEQAYAMDVELYFDIPGQDGDYGNSDFIQLTIWPEMRHTVAKMLELGIVRQEDLITRQEYDRKGMEAVEEVPVETASAAENVIIGAADDAATVVVS